jgi:hypothetical protein
MSESTSTPATGLLDPALLDRYLKALDRPLPDVQPDTTPSSSGLFTRIISKLGEFAGSPGPETLKALSPREREDAGLQALSRFGTGLLQASGSGQWIGSNLGRAFAGAERGYDETGRQAVGNLAARQGYAIQQQQDQLARIKEALPLLTLAQQQALVSRVPYSVGGGGGGGAPSGDTGDGTYVGAIGGHEGTGQNPFSSAVGVGQFIDSTWGDFIKDNPQYFAGMTPEQAMASRKDPAFGKQIGPIAIEWLAKQNAPILATGGVAPSGQSLGIAHYLGAVPAAQVMVAPDNVPVSQFLGKKALDANPELRTMTVGQIKARYANTPNPSFMRQAAATPSATPPPAGGAPAPPAPVGTQPPGTQVATPPPVQVAGPGAASVPTAAAPEPTAPATPPPAPSAGPPVFTYTPSQIPPGLIPPGTFTPAQQAAMKTIEDAYVHERQVAATPADVQKAESNFGTNMTKVLGSQTDAAKVATDALLKFHEADFKQQQDTHGKMLMDYIDQQKFARENAAKAVDAAQAQKYALELKRAETAGTIEQQGQLVSLKGDEKRLESIGTAASAAQQVSTSIRQLIPVIQSLPPSSPVMAALGAYPQLTGYLKSAGIISSDTADNVSLFQGLTDHLSTQLRTSGTGSMSDNDLATFKRALPQLMASPDGRLKAAAFLQNLADRVVQEQEFTSDYFRRVENGKQANNLSHLNDALKAPRRLDENGINRGGLGPVVPQAPRGMDYQTAQEWLRTNVESGHPYTAYLPGNDKPQLLVRE